MVGSIPLEGIVAGMRVGTKLAAYGMVLAVAFAAGTAVGAVVGPDAGDDGEPSPTVSAPDVHDVHED
jgi:hypothetical protein